MNASLRDLQKALQTPNILAFLAVIGEGESSNDPSAYRTIVGGQHYDGDLSQHPRIAVETKWGWSSGFGKYQIMAAVEGKVKTNTYDWLAKELGPSMEPAEQDLKAVRLIDHRGALDLVKEGRFSEATVRCAYEWASLPGSPYGQPRLTLEKAIEIFRAYGGTLAQDAPKEPAPVESQAPQAAPEVVIPQTVNIPSVAPIPIPKAKPMGVLAALLPTIIQMIPQLGQLFGSGSEVSNRNIAAAKVVADTVVAATQSTNVQDAIEKMQGDGTVLQTARDAVSEILPQLMDVGGGVESARKFAAEHETGRYGRILEVVTYCAMAFLFLANIFAFVVYLRSGDLGPMNTVTQADIGAALIAFGYFLGSSISSKRKDEMAGSQ